MTQNLHNKIYISVNLYTSLHQREKPTRNKTPGTIKILNINCQSVVNKKDHLQTVIDSENPDIIVGTESWLSPSIYDGEIFPPSLGYSVYRRDRETQTTGGGIFIMVRNTFMSNMKPQFNTSCEVMWVEVEVRGTKPIFTPYNRIEHSTGYIVSAIDSETGY